MKNLLQRLYNSTIGKLVREFRYRKRIKEIRKRDPFIYK